MINIVSILTDAISMGTVYLFGSVGETLTEKAPLFFLRFLRCFQPFPQPVFNNFL